MPDKLIERRALTALIESLPELSTATIEDGERPDFILNLPERQIGVEVTRHAPSSDISPNPKQQNALQQRVISSAEARWYEVSSLGIDVAAEFLEQYPLNKTRVPTLAIQIVKFLQPRVSALAMYEWATYMCNDRHEILPEIHSFHVIRVPNRDYGVWQAGEGSWVRHATKLELSKLVAEKEKKLRSYRSTAPEVWLLATFQHMDAGDVVEVPAYPVEFVLTTNFDRIFALNVHSKQLVEIPCHRYA